MKTAIIAFAAGVAWLQWQPALPQPLLLAALACVGVGLVAVRRWLPARAYWIAAIGAFLLGVSWAGLRAHQRLADALPEADEGRDVALVGVVAGLPQRTDRGWRFEFDVEQPANVPRHVSLAWYGDARGADEEEPQAAGVQPVHVGERWRLVARLKRPHGNRNPHGYDYEAALLERGVRATGYVRTRQGAVREDAFVWRFGYAIERMREGVRDRFQRVLGDARYAGVLAALAVGDQRAIDPGLWQVFARTGTTHLMSISGSHVTLLAGMVWGVVSLLWRRSSRLPLHVPAQKAAAAAGLLAALGYSLIAGFEVPAQRTLYMLGIVTLSFWSGRNVSGSRVLALALLVVLVADPWAVLSAGFWLSFGAVGLLFYVGAGRIGRRRWLAEWGRAQWAVTVGMLPALLALFQVFSLASPLANAVAIPVVGFVVTPLALAGSLPFGDPLLWLAHLAMEWQMALLSWLAASQWAVWQQHAPPPWAVPLALAGIGWLLLPRGFPARWLGIVACLPLVTVPPLRPAAGTVVATVLDVGHGLSVHVQTQHHDLLYDAGPAFSADADSGNRIIVPYLRAIGVRRLDGMMVSHDDIDHSGGAASVIDALPVAWLSSSLPFEHALSAVPVVQRPCRDGDAWEWDGVRFAVLHPAAGQPDAPGEKSNDMSCVLKVTAGGHGILLTGDIETVSEEAIRSRHADELAADVITAPHHGSRSSSSAEFVAAVGAREAVFSVGYRNRFGHPKNEVVERYRGSGAALWRTDADGALVVRLAPEGVEASAERARHRRYWAGR